MAKVLAQVDELRNTTAVTSDEFHAFRSTILEQVDRCTSQSREIMSQSREIMSQSEDMMSSVSKRLTRFRMSKTLSHFNTWIEREWKDETWLDWACWCWCVPTELIGLEQTEWKATELIGEDGLAIIDLKQFEQLVRPEDVTDFTKSLKIGQKAHLEDMIACLEEKRARNHGRRCALLPSDFRWMMKVYLIWFME